MKYIMIILLVAMVGAGYMYRDALGLSITASEKKEKKKDKKSDHKEPASAGVSIVKEWQLPDRLKEISGLSYIDASRFACVQDEEGVMFVYNIQNQQIEKEIPFGGAGDYEGITLAGTTAYIVRSDGTLFEISNWNTKPVTKQYKTSLTAKHNVEGLVYDKAANQLLLGIKDNEPATKDYKGVYAFDLDTKSFVANPVYKIDMTNDRFAGKKKGLRPSGIAIHPSSNDLFIVDGPTSRLMVMDITGNIKQVINLGNSFEQPEGVTFNPQGDIFISNEGVNKPGNIIQLTVN